ncbi:MAG: hypothetical protein KME64_13205 [Scytonematopsis contorta HA4267-MV1]|nr:hypothetical protein [Scytonematopsis contorta HA4267-MV1]
MPQVKGANTKYPQLVAQIELNHYISQQVDVVADEIEKNAYFLGLGEATSNILRQAFYLAESKETRSKLEYKQLLAEHGWKKEDKKYLKLAAIFSKFSPQDLAAIEPDTLFLLAKNHKKYAPVLEKLLDSGEITQEKVRQLMSEQRKPKTSAEEKASIWRRTPQGFRYTQIPPIHDETTGVILQRMMDEEGLSAQQIVTEALSLRKSFKAGLLIEVSNSQQLDDLVNEEFVYEELSVNNVNNNEVLEEVLDLSINDNPKHDEILENIISEEIINVVLSPVVVEVDTRNETNNVDCFFSTLESLTIRLDDIVENKLRLNRKLIKVAEKLVGEIVDFCDQQPIAEQWDTLASITRRHSDGLMMVIGFLGKEHRDWFFNLPQILAYSALKNPSELEWVTEHLRQQAVELMCDM